jgi:7-keto-8-aminopelargonate synthetase-like enzyme
VLHVKVVDVHAATLKVLARAFVIVMEPVASDNGSAGPFAEIDNTTCELLTILRTKYTVSAAMPPKTAVAVLLIKTTVSDTENALKLEQVNK